MTTRSGENGDAATTLAVAIKTIAEIHKRTYSVCVVDLRRATGTDAPAVAPASWQRLAPRKTRRGMGGAYVSVVGVTHTALTI
jgi:hypothetical protein